MQIQKLLEIAKNFNQTATKLYHKLNGIDSGLAKDFLDKTAQLYSNITLAATSETPQTYFQKISSAYAIAGQVLRMLNNFKNLELLDNNLLQQATTQCGQLLQKLSLFTSSTHINFRRKTGY